MTGRAWPTVSVIMPMRNEEGHIERCLQQVFDNDYPQELVEIVIADGQSTDRSVEIVKSIQRDHPGVHLYSNDGRRVPHGLNTCLKHATGEVVVRFDVHAEYPPDYIRQCVTALLISDAVCVGGTQDFVTDSYMSRAVAAALASSFGAGGARYRVSSSSEYVDTVWLGCWRRESLLQLGGYKEEVLCSEDYELAFRLRKRGGKILLSNAIHAKYYARTGVRLFRQYLHYGFWKPRLMFMHPASVRLRQVVPALFMVALIASLATVPITPKPLLWILGLYFLAAFAASIVVAAKRSWALLPVLPYIFMILHWSWGLGAVVGSVYWAIYRLRGKEVPLTDQGSIHIVAPQA